MRLSNFRIPSAVIGLTLMSGVAVLFSEPITYAQSTQQVASEPSQYFPSQITPNHESPWDCFSGRGCEGKVLSHRDPHNCKVKSRGKSCWNKVTKQCFNL
jgi:hypothetical protein